MAPRVSATPRSLSRSGAQRRNGQIRRQAGPLRKPCCSAEPSHAVPLIGIGGTHYAPRETAIALSSRGAFGHIATSKRQVAVLDREMVQAMIVQSGAVAAYIDRKAMPTPIFHGFPGSSTS